MVKIFKRVKIVMPPLRCLNPRLLIRSQTSFGSHQQLFYTHRCFSEARLSSLPPALSKVLVANRGEIACRVIRTCRLWGIPTVAIYSSADGSDALHCRMADECYLIGTGPTATESYLQGEAILDIAARAQVDAIHPGYGFLSEHAAFSAMVAERGIRFVGPPAHAMEAMASKSRSKAIMDAAGVPTTPGFYCHGSNDNNHGDSNTNSDQSDDHLLYQASTNVGFPLLIKAVSGGGGRGMRLVERESDFRAALVSCRHEAQASFGDDRVLLERYLRRPRHVEVQIVADSHGHCLHLFERDCSLQRRHQKVIEEAPASDLSPSVRHQMGEMAKRAAMAVGYVNAGTVEFLVDTASLETSPEQPSFYFCEMNTRLQVEHPITELVTGIDLVEWQLRIAAGEVLPIIDQEKVTAKGHAFEARIYAEHPDRNFAPATGIIWHHNPPVPINVGLVDVNSSGGNVTNKVRVDSGLQVGQSISVYYDSMMSKLITHGPDRTQALQALVTALKSYHIAGVPTNIDFLIRCAQHATFRTAGAVTTAFLDEHAEDVFIINDSSTAGSVGANTVSSLGRAAVALAVLLRLEHRIGDHSTNGSSSASKCKAPWSSHWGSWRMGGALARPQRELHMRDGVTVNCISNRDGSYELSWSSDREEEVSLHIDGYLNNDGTMEIVVNRTERALVDAALRTDIRSGTLQVRLWPKDRPNEFVWSLDVDNPMTPLSTNIDSSVGTRGSGASQGIVQAPMPGKISRINFDVGDTVQAGDIVVVLEAMKMEHSMSAPISGVIAELLCQPKDVVDDGAVLFCIADGSEEEPSTAAN